MAERRRLQDTPSASRSERDELVTRERELLLSGALEEQRLQLEKYKEIEDEFRHSEEKYLTAQREIFTLQQQNMTQMDNYERKMQSLQNQISKLTQSHELSLARLAQHDEIVSNIHSQNEHSLVTVQLQYQTQMEEHQTNTEQLQSEVEVISEQNDHLQESLRISEHKISLLQRQLNDKTLIDSQKRNVEAKNHRLLAENDLLLKQCEQYQTELAVYQKKDEEWRQFLRDEKMVIKTPRGTQVDVNFDQLYNTNTHTIDTKQDMIRIPKSPKPGHSRQQSVNSASSLASSQLLSQLLKAKQIGSHRFRDDISVQSGATNPQFVTLSPPPVHFDTMSQTSTAICLTDHIPKPHRKGSGSGSSENDPRHHNMKLRPAKSRRTSKNAVGESRESRESIHSSTTATTDDVHDGPATWQDVKRSLEVKRIGYDRKLSLNLQTNAGAGAGAASPCYPRMGSGNAGMGTPRRSSLSGENHMMDAMFEGGGENLSVEVHSQNEEMFDKMDIMEEDIRSMKNLLTQLVEQPDPMMNANIDHSLRSILRLVRRVYIMVDGNPALSYGSAGGGGTEGGNQSGGEVTALRFERNSNNISIFDRSMFDDSGAANVGSGRALFNAFLNFIGISPSAAPTRRRSSRRAPVATAVTGGRRQLSTLQRNEKQTKGSGYDYGWWPSIGLSAGLITVGMYVAHSYQLQWQSIFYPYSQPKKEENSIMSIT